eukprot:gene532-8044_t
MPRYAKQANEDYEEQEDQERKRLSLSVVGAMELPRSDLLQKLNPYCVCYLESTKNNFSDPKEKYGVKEYHQTKKVSNSTEPIWNGRFALFPYENDAIIFEIYNSGYVSSGQLATLRLPINSLQLENQKDFEFWVKMDTNAKVITLTNKKPELHLILCAENFGKGLQPNYEKNIDLVKFADEVFNYITEKHVHIPEEWIDAFDTRFDMYDKEPTMKAQELLLKTMRPIVDTLESDAVVFQNKKNVKRLFPTQKL